MLQQIANDIYAEVREISLDLQASTEPQRRRQALQYVLQNRGMQSVAVRVDFSASERVQLVFPAGHNGKEDSGATLGFVVAMGPLQREGIVNVLRDDQARAFVRVEYSMVEDAAEDGDRGRLEVGTNDVVLNKVIDHSRVMFNALYKSQRSTFSVRDPLAVPLGSDAIRRMCRDVNRFTRQHRVKFVDRAFSPSPTALWSSPKPPESMKAALAAQNATWRHLGDVVDSSWSFVECTTNPSELDWVHEGLPGQESWICATDSLSDQAPLWCKQWFGEQQSKRLSRRRDPMDGEGVVVVDLCEDGRQWAPVVVDLFIPVVISADGKSGLLSAWPTSGEFYAVLLHKAYAKLCGSYAAIALKSTRCILEELTGVPTIELFPREAWHHVEVVDITRRLEKQSKKSKKTIGQRLIMVSFEGIDEHHCAFQLLGAVSPTLSTTRGFVVRDPTRMLLSRALSRLGCDSGVEEEDRQCVLTEEVFVQLGPTVFQVLTSHTNSWRRRRILHSRSSRVISSQFAVSCASLQTLVVRGFATQLDSLTEVTVELSGIAVDRVGEDDSTARLGDEEVQVAGGQCAWTACAGEYLVTISATVRGAAHNDGDSATCARKLTERDVEDNLRLLFLVLDEDMDGIVSRSELLDWFRVHEVGDNLELGEISNLIDDFIETHSSNCGTDAGHRGLNLDDWIGAYQSFHGEDSILLGERPTAKETIASNVWSDLLVVLGLEDAAEIDVGDLVVLTCVVSSDRDDVILVSLK